MISLLSLRQKCTMAVRPIQRQRTLYSHAFGVLALILGLLLASAEADTRLQANKYTEIKFKGGFHKFVFTVPDNSVATLQVTELGCPGNRFYVTSGTKYLFRTSSVPSRIFCRKPYNIASASAAFADPYYSKGSVRLAAGDYTVRVTPFSRATAAAIGLFFKPPPTVPTSGGSNQPTTTVCRVPVVTETEVISLTSTVVLTDEAPSATAVSSKSIQTPTNAIVSLSTPLPQWMARRWSPQIRAKEEGNFDVVTVTAEASTRIVTVSEDCETTTATTAVETSTTSESETTTVAPETTTSSPPQSTTEVSATTAPEPETTTASEVTTSSEPEPTSVPTETVEPSWTSTTETPTVEPTLTSEPETTTSDVTTTAEPSSTTETTPPSTTTDGATSTPSVPTPVATCNGQSRYLKLVTKPFYLFKDAEEACGADYGVARISTFKEIRDAINLLLTCGVERAWIKAESANTINHPKCYAVSQDKTHEPANCEQEMMQVLCSTP